MKAAAPRALDRHPQARGHDLGLDPGVKDGAGVLPLLRPYPAARMFAYPASSWVNDPKHEGAKCVERAG